MELSKVLSIVLLITVSNLFPATEVRADDGVNSQIIPVVTVAPNLFAVGQFSTTFVCVSNGNPSSTKSIQGGDTFTLTFDPSIGVVASVASPVLVNSSNLNAADFVANLGSALNEIVISYLGATKVFMPGDSFCLKVTFTANSVIGSGKITGEAPSSKGDEGRYNKIDPKYTTVSIVDFPTGPPGPPGSGSVTSVSANSPLSVTNPTTTPNISLGVVPAVNGGTGLTSAGAAGNFLRSDGGAWTTAPLSAADIPDLGSSYIRNATALQSSSNFNISGTGTANVLSAAAQYNLGADRVLSNPGTNNLFAGVGAGAVNTGESNSFFGNSAGLANTTGRFSSFFGSGAGRANTGGSNNSFFGSNAGLANTTGFQNSFFGREAGVNNTEGSFNSFFGRSTGLSNTTGGANNLFGQNAGLRNTTGSLNSLFGSSAGQENTTGDGNSFFGDFAGDTNTTGSHNTAIGRGADVGANNLTFATAIGADAVVSTSNTVVLGRSADTVQVPGALNVSGTFGANILDVTTQFNIGGSRILSSAGFGFSNLFVGIGAGAANTTGSNNSFFGRDAGLSNTTGGLNSFFGTLAGRANTTGGANSLFGNSAGRENTTGSFNSFFGDNSGQANTTGFNNSFFGYETGLRDTTGEGNSFFGSVAGRENTTGRFNSFFGVSAGNLNTTGVSNSFFGSGAGRRNTTGNNNIFLGLNAGLGNMVGNNITIVGTTANVAADNLDHATAIGADAVVGTSNTVVLGRGADTVQIPGALNVTGAFSANILNATTQFNLGGNRILSNPGTNNLFAGVGAGAVNTGASNSFFGVNAGQANTTGGANSFFGKDAGNANTTGIFNSFFGTNAGSNSTNGNSNSFFGTNAGGNNTNGESNSFFGNSAGHDNTTGDFNSFFGSIAGNKNSTGRFNSFFGRSAGFQNTTGEFNSFFGTHAGNNNATGNNNTFIGRSADFSGVVMGTGDRNTLLGFSASVDSTLNNATAIGANARVTQSDSLVLGGISGVNGGTNTNVGIGTTAPAARLHVVGTTGLIGDVGIGTTSPDRTLTVAGRARISNIPLEPSGASLCFDFNGNLLQCGASSLRFKTNVQPFLGGVDIVRRLRPINFNWKESGLPDIGLGAEEVAKVAPSFAFTNDKGEVTGVKYERLNMLLINAIKEQQAQIKTLQEVNSALSVRLHKVETALRKKSSRARRR